MKKLGEIVVGDGINMEGKLVLPQCLGPKKGSLKVASEGMKGSISPREESWLWDIS